jgi:hypothetical protein
MHDASATDDLKMINRHFKFSVHIWRSHVLLERLWFEQQQQQQQQKQQN